MATDDGLWSSLLPPPPQRPQRITSAAAAWIALSVAAALALLLLLLLVAGFGLPSASRSTSRRGHPGSSPPDPVELTLLAAAHDKGAVCLDGSPPGYHLQPGSGAGSRSWLIHLEGGGWCDTVRSCAGRTLTDFGSSKFMQRQINFTGILSNDPVLNPDFYSWNRVFVRYCDGASFAGDSQHEDGNGTLFFRGRRIWEAVLDELMQKGLAHSKQALLTGCSAGGLATLLHCNDFRARFPQEVSVKCLPDAGFFLDAKDLSGQRHMRSVYNGVVHLQNVTKVLPKDCLLANKDPTECFFPAEIIKSISTPTFIVNSAYDTWQVQNVVATDSSSPDESWRRCRADIRSCNSSQIQVLNEFRKEMVDGLTAVEDNTNCSWFIDSCFTHCQAWFDNSPWNHPVSPRLGSKTLVEAVGDWYFGRSQNQVVREIGCEYPCNPTCNSDKFPT
ncbi:hypothetical protein SEVIR_5G079400v4 [Setaria viridis]|uniref:Pectin acetylesterase n=1 Tax=Setaria viridis TaxID=4556 RepID=A0A4U6UB78_SETVI|nr:pectin acetylesterase 5-like [Setaria viridis]TKW13140.1 hypothetical protein SEVIR_5G079400v2 [Setaria viridis]